MFSCELWEICKNTFLIENLRWLLLSIRLWTTKIAFSITIQMIINRDPSTVLNRQHKWVTNLIFPLIQISPSLVELFWSLLHYYHLLFCRTNAAWYALEKEKNKMINSMKRQVFLIDLSFRIDFLFGFWENGIFTSYVACHYCVICSCKKAFK